MRVQVYWNLHKGCWSVQALEGENKGRVIDHTDSLRLHDCQFVVRESGRQRVLKEKRKNVHAFVRGRIPEENVAAMVRKTSVATYNPYKGSSFVALEGDKVVPVSKARAVTMGTQESGKPVVLAHDYA